MSNENSPKALLQRYRVKIARVIMFTVLAYTFGYERISIMPFDSAIGLAGIAVLLLGVLVRSISAGVLHKNDILATAGIYAIVRNPLYLGSLLILFGFNIIIANWLIAVTSIGLYLLTYVPTILREEQGLDRVYGEEWRAYVARSTRLFPNLLRLGALADIRWNYAQWRKNHEHNTVLAAITVLTVLWLYNTYLSAQ